MSMMLSFAVVASKNITENNLNLNNTTLNTAVAPVGLEVVSASRVIAAVETQIAISCPRQTGRFKV